jgi:hypothetical protein
MFEDFFLADALSFLLSCSTLRLNYVVLGRDPFSPAAAAAATPWWLDIYCRYKNSLCFCFARIIFSSLAKKCVDPMCAATTAKWKISLGSNLHWP